MQQRPLSGFRVLEFGGYISGPYATSFLNSLGAEVVKVEPITGDAFRRNLDHVSPYFVQYNAGKKSFAVDLKTAEGLRAVEALIPEFDVLVENMRPGKLDRLGLGADHCSSLNPRLVYTSVTGFGSVGPFRDRPAYDTIGQAFGGLYSLLSPEDDPNLSGTILADLISGCVTAMGVLGALVGRSATGEGNRVETSIAEAVSTLTIDAMTQYFETGADPSLQSRHPQAQNFCLATGSGDRIAVHLSNSDVFWRRLCLAIERPELLDDHRFRTYRDRETNYFVLAGELRKVLLERTSTEWEARLGDHDVPFAPVLSMSGYSSHAQVRELGVIDVEERAAGTPLVQPPWRFGGERSARSRASPRVGEHTREIALTALPEDVVDELLEAEIIFGPRTMAGDR